MSSMCTCNSYPPTGFGRTIRNCSPAFAEISMSSFPYFTGIDLRGIGILVKISPAPSRTSIESRIKIREYSLPEFKQLCFFIPYIFYTWQHIVCNEFNNNVSLLASTYCKNSLPSRGKHRADIFFSGHQVEKKIHPLVLIAG